LVLAGEEVSDRAHRQPGLSRDGAHRRGRDAVAHDDLLHGPGELRSSGQMVDVDRQRRGGERSQQPEHAAMHRQPREQTTTPTKWAPWWLYLVIIVGANYLRRATVGT
jgi:hypothetical protein